MKQAIMGAGSLGTILGALLQLKGHDVDLIDTWDEHVQALNEKGAVITGKMQARVPVHAITPDMMASDYDIVYYLVKSTADEIALPMVRDHLKNDGVVVVMQNGLPEEKVAEYVGADRVIAAPIGWGATLLEPGVSQLTSDYDKMTFDLGELDGRDSPRLNEIANILNQVGVAHKSNNIIGLRWVKLAANSAFSALSTVMGGTFGDVLDNAKALYCAANITKEALDTMEASGVIPATMQGADIRMLNFTCQEEYQKLVPVYEFIFNPHRALRASMLQDLEKGKGCEIESINGAIVKAGARYNLDTPVNRQVVQIIKDIEQGSRQPGYSNLDDIIIAES